MLQGSQIARAIRGIKIVYEALFRVFYDAFKIYMQNSNLLNPIEVTESKLDDLAHAFSMNNKDITYSAVDEIVDEHLGNISEALIEFRTAGRESSATFKFWDDFMEGAKVLLHLIRTEREGNFDLHLNAMCESLPWFRAAGRLNSAKYTPIYVADMRALEEQHPQSFQHLVSGGFVVRRTNNHNFNAVSTDQALEQTINKEGKSQGGIIGLTLRKKALNRWLLTRRLLTRRLLTRRLLTRHVTAEYSEALTMICKEKSSNQRKMHEELGKSRLSQDESDVQSVVSLIKQNQNAFDLEASSPQLTNIVSGQVATANVTKSMNDFLEGKNCHETFMESKLLLS